MSLIGQNFADGTFLMTKFRQTKTYPTTNLTMSENDVTKSDGGESAEAAILELEKRITDAFLVFDTQENKQVDVREIGTGPFLH